MFLAEYMAAAGAGECNHSLKHCHVLRSDSQLPTFISIIVFYVESPLIFFKCAVGNHTRHL